MYLAAKLSTLVKNTIVGITVFQIPPILHEIILPKTQNGFNSVTVSIHLKITERSWLVLSNIASYNVSNNNSLFH